MRRIALDALRLAVVALAAFYIAVFVGVALIRLRYPYELEWMEGGMVDQVRWILAGHKLYQRPSIEFVSFIYNPLYFYLCAAVSKVVGVGFFPLRLVSVLSSLGVFVLLYAIASYETGSRMVGVIAAGMYAATFKLTSQFMDIARVDSLFVMLILAPVYLLRTHPSAGGRIAAAVVVVLAFWTKQSALALACTLALHVLIEYRSRAWPFVAIAALGIGGGVFLYDHIHDGWYWYFCFDVPSRHQYIQSLWIDFWAFDLMARLGVAAVGLFFLFIADLDGSRRRLYLLAFGGALAASYLPRVKAGGWTNTLLPAYAFVCLLGSIGLGRALERAARVVDSPTALRLQAFALCAAGVQLAMLGYDPRFVVPGRSDREAGDEFIAKIAASPGEVFMPTHSFLPVLAHKRSYLHQQAVDDIINAGGPVAILISDEIRAALREKRFELVITDNDFFATDVRRNYLETEKAFAVEGVFYPITGVHYRPGGLFRPRR